MAFIHEILVSVHIACGAAALLLFWVPALTRKGSRMHVAAGRWYARSMYAVCVTAFVASILVLADPLGTRRPGQVFEPAEAAALAERFRLFSLFLLMISVLVAANLRHGLLALRELSAPGALGSPLHRLTLATLTVLAVTVGAVGIAAGEWLLIAFAGIGMAASVGMFRDLRSVSPSRQDLVAMHLNGLIGSGIGAYTAFTVFGGSRLFAELLVGQWLLIPWLAPAVIGSVVIFVLRRRYERRAGQPA